VEISLEMLRDAGWTGLAEAALFAAALALIALNAVTLIGGLRAMRAAENPLNAHLITPLYERHAGYPKMLKALAVLSVLTGVLGWATRCFLALNEAASLPGPIIARDFCASLSAGSLVLAAGAFNALVAYGAYCVFGAVLAVRHSRAVKRISGPGLRR